MYASKRSWRPRVMQVKFWKHVIHAEILGIRIISVCQQKKNKEFNNIFYIALFQFPWKQSIVMNRELVSPNFH
jgi:hypothetical protein